MRRRKKNYFFASFILTIAFLLLFISCDENFFEDGVTVNNKTEWTISVCFSSDKENPTGGGWTTITKDWHKNVPAKDGNWYLGIRTDGSKASANAPPVQWSASTMRTGSISSIDVTFVDGVGAHYSYKINYK